MRPVLERLPTDPIFQGMDLRCTCRIALAVGTAVAGIAAALDARVVPVGLALGLAVAAERAVAGRRRAAGALLASLVVAVPAAAGPPSAAWACAGAAAGLTAWLAVALLVARTRATADLDSVLLALEGPEDVVWRTVRAASDVTSARTARVVRRDDAPLAADSMARGAVRSDGTTVAIRAGDAVVLLEGVRRRIDGTCIALLERIAAVLAASVGAERADGGHTDPITGLGDRQYALRAVADAGAGDTVLLVGFADPGRLGSSVEAELLACQLGLHLRSATRPGDVVGRLDELTYLVVAREASGSGAALARRFVGSWWLDESEHRVVCTVHDVDGRAAIDLVDELAAALRTSQGRRAPAGQEAVAVR